MHIPPHDLWWLAAGGASYGARYVRIKVRQYRSIRRRSREPDPTEVLLQLQSEFGYNEHSLVSIAPGAAAWTMPGLKGAIVYSEFEHVWLAAGDPLVGKNDLEKLLTGFMATARRHRRVVAFVPATEKFTTEALKLGLSAIKIGAAPYFDLPTWNPRGNAAKKMRAGINQATRAGVTVSEVKTIGHEFRAEANNLCLEWLRTRRSATTFGWLLALDPLLHSERKLIFAARNSEGRLVSLVSASPIPLRNGWYIEDVLRIPEAPQGTVDLLVVHTLQHLKSMGASLATLGTAPLAKDANDISIDEPLVLARALVAASRRFSVFYNFDGIRMFKAKFVPTFWESEYILVPRGATVPPRVAHAMLRAIVPGGLKQLIARKALRSLKG